MKKDEMTERMKLLFNNHDEAILCIETILGMSAEMTLFIGDKVKDFINVPEKIKYAMGIISMYMLAYMDKRELLKNVEKIDISKISNVDEKLDTVLKYLSEVYEKRKKELSEN